MKIENLLKKENILQIPFVANKWELMRLLVEKLIESYQDENYSDDLKQSLHESVITREKQSSTSMGSGIAFPHGRINGLNKPLIALATIRDGIDFNDSDQIPTKLVFLFLFPGNRHELGVKIQSVFARFLLTENNAEKIINAQNPEEIHNLIYKADLQVNTPIIAQDLMKCVPIQFSGDMLLNNATNAMKKFNSEVAAIVNDVGELVGEIDCIHLFQLELPDYIKKLHSVPSIHDFNPFSKFFANNKELAVKDVMNKDVAVVAPDASLLEIIFLLAVKKHFVVHVCENGKLIGSIDRISVLDKVFNL
jgi:PTS system nitrogen regulatory IIA component